MEECSLLTETRGLVEKEEMREWGTRHSRDKKKNKGDVGTEKEKEKEEGERLANFFLRYMIFLFHLLTLPMLLFRLGYQPVTQLILYLLFRHLFLILLCLFLFPLLHLITPSFHPPISLFLLSTSFLLVLSQETHSYVL